MTEPVGTPPSADDQIDVIRLRHALEDENVLTFAQGDSLLDAYVAQRAELTRLRAERDHLHAKLQHLDRDHATTATQIRQARAIYEEIPAELEQARVETRTIQTAYTALLIDLRALVEQFETNRAGEERRSVEADSTPEPLRGQRHDDRAQIWRKAKELLAARLAREPQHIKLFHELERRVAALDPAAADDQPQNEWTAAKWAVFNAAVRLVKETAQGGG